MWRAVSVARNFGQSGHLPSQENSGLCHGVWSQMQIMTEKILEVFPEKILGDFFVLLMCPRKSRFVNFLKGIYVFSSQSLSINVCLFRMCLQGGLGALSCLVSALRKRESLCLGDQYSKSDLIRWMNDLQVSGFWENITYLISHCFSIELCIYNIIMFTVCTTQKKSVFLGNLVICSLQRTS